MLASYKSALSNLLRSSVHLVPELPPHQPALALAKVQEPAILQQHDRLPWQLGIVKSNILAAVTGWWAFQNTGRLPFLMDIPQLNMVILLLLNQAIESLPQNQFTGSACQTMPVNGRSRRAGLPRLANLKSWSTYSPATWKTAIPDLHTTTTFKWGRWSPCQHW